MMKITKIISDKEIYRQEFFGHTYSTRELIVDMVDNGKIKKGVTIKCNESEYKEILSSLNMTGI